MQYRARVCFGCAVMPHEQNLLHRGQTVGLSRPICQVGWLLAALFQISHPTAMLSVGEAATKLRECLSSIDMVVLFKVKYNQENHAHWDLTAEELCETFAHPATIFWEGAVEFYWPKTHEAEYVELEFLMRQYVQSVIGR